MKKLKKDLKHYIFKLKQFLNIDAINNSSQFK
jgi:hypothetical protein